MTLNLGVRWDVQTPGTDPHEPVHDVRAGQKSTVNAIAPIGLLFYGDPGVERGVISTRWNHVSPRAGIVWDPTGKGRTAITPAAAVLRQHFGQRMEHDHQLSAVVDAADVPEHEPANDVRRRPLGASLSNPYNAYPGGAPFPYNGTFVVGGGLYGISQDFTWSHAWQTNVGIQQQIGERLGVRVSYIGTFLRDLPFARDVNYPVANSTATAAGASVLARRPDPTVGAVLLLDSDQYSNYNGLQITQRRAPGTSSDSAGFTPIARP
jgi:hypothetical protein